MRNKADVLVIGGGASGLTAAIAAKEANPRADVVIAERLSRVGKKILATGNGRCNLGNTDIKRDRFHGSVANVTDILNGTPSAADYFASLGVVCVNDDYGRIYPRSNTATSVLTALRIRLKQLNICELCDFDVKAISNNGCGYTVYGGNFAVDAGCVIVAAGGSAAPVFGTDGQINGILRDMGHYITPLSPGIAPLAVDRNNTNGLKGIRAKVNVSAFVDGNKIAEEFGEIQFNDGQLSGICVFNLSHFWAKHKQSFRIDVDFAPDFSSKQLFDLLCNIQHIRYDCIAEEFLTGIFHKNIGIYLLESLGIDISRSVCEIDPDMLRRLCNRIKSTEFPVIKTSPWSAAQVTCGGIHGSEVGNDLQSKRCPGIYFAGEILDVNGICGGYNLAWAWASGIWVGRNAKKVM